MIEVKPIDDLKEHTEGSTCECQPRVIFENSEMIVIHSSFDGREALEEFYETLKDKKWAKYYSQSAQNVSNRIMFTNHEQLKNMNKAEQVRKKLDKKEKEVLKMTKIFLNSHGIEYNEIHETILKNTIKEWECW